MAEQEMRFAARIEAVMEAMTASSGVAVDALALLAMRDRALLENLLKFRRLEHQAGGSKAVSAEIIKRYELALDIADALTSARPLGPR